MSKAAIAFRKEVSIGHRLRDYVGKCASPHGHNYTFDITVDGEIDLQTGLIMDFKDLKHHFDHVLAPFDHAMILRSDDPLIPHLVDDQHAKLVVLDVNPTAENLAGLFYGLLNQVIQNDTNGRVGMRNLQLFETDSGMAIAVRSLRDCIQLVKP